MRAGRAASARRAVRRRLHATRRGRTDPRTSSGAPSRPNTGLCRFRTGCLARSRSARRPNCPARVCARQAPTGHGADCTHAAQGRYGRARRSGAPSSHDAHWCMQACAIAPVTRWQTESDRCGKVILGPPSHSTGRGVFRGYSMTKLRALNLGSPAKALN